MIEITAEIRAFIDKAAAGAELAEDEYIDPSDGLIHCKKCGGQRQTVVPCFGKPGYFMPRCICQCQREAEEQCKAAEERQRRMERIKRRKAQGLQDRYLYDYTFANDNGQNPLMDKARAYVENWKEAYKSNIGLLLFGDVGTGKSFFAGCIANALLDRDVPVLMTNFPTILNRLTGMFSEDRADFIASFDEYDLLIIDDLGVERSTEYAMEQKITDLDAMKIAEQKRAVRSGYDMDILPSDLATYGGAAKSILQDLQSRNERMFNLTFLVMHMAETRQKLEIAVSQAASVAQTYNCQLSRLDFQQEDGLMSSLPLGLNRIRIERSLTTSALAVFVPFVTQELFMGGDAMYYGLNALSNNMILLDRKQSRSPNGLVFGTPGSGKSMSCKREITFIILTTKDNVIICDPEDEYSPLVNRLGGQVIELSPSSTDYLNPLDINLNYSEEENPLALKSDFVLSFCELIMGSKTGLEAIEKTVIDRAVQKIYQPYFADPRPENMPILGDLMEALQAQHIPEADRVAQALDLYVNGSLNFFNHRTTVNSHNRLVCFDIKGLGKNLKKPGMLIVQDAVWNTVTINRAIGRSTWYFVDEFHLLLKEEQTAAYSAEIWKRFRKWGGVPTGATQNPKDLLSSPEIENILENSDFIYMLNQAAGDRKILADRLNISSEQLAYVTNSEPGHGLLFFNNVILPFADDFPKDTELYKLLTTKPSEVEHETVNR